MFNVMIETYEKKDVRYAANTMNALQGYVLFSSDRGGMRIEFAKNKMGETSLNGTSVSNGLQHQHMISVSITF
jgi:hypothetical protein